MKKNQQQERVCVGNVKVARFCWKQDVVRLEGVTVKFSEGLQVLPSHPGDLCLHSSLRWQIAQFRGMSYWRCSQGLSQGLVSELGLFNIEQGPGKMDSVI